MFIWLILALAALLAVHAVWDEWSPWSLCSSTCGRGYRSRTRICTPPQFGGDPCDGPEKQTKFCNIAVCPGETSTQPKMTTTSKKCFTIIHCLCCVFGLWPCQSSVDGFWNEWSSWSSCSVSCSNGTMQRTRECNNPSYGGSECRGQYMETVDCFLGECPGMKLYMF